MSLLTYISQQTSIEDIGTYLDNLSASDRLSETRTLSKKMQQRLYALAESSSPLDLDFFVPTDTSLAEVVHNGRNTLPIFTLFQKRFCRSNDGTNRVFGYNHGSTTNFIGPGYFVAKSTSGNSEWEKRGSVVIDYYEVPNSEVVPTWPQIKSNGSGLQRLVYYQMHDFMRRVSSHVSIGIAYQKGKNMGQYFILCRQD
jgi:hypothetical protein